MPESLHTVDITDPDQLYGMAKMYGHLSGFFGWKDLSLNYLFVSDSTAKLVGYNSAEDFIGSSLSDVDLRCPASELSEQFAVEDKLVIQHKKPVRILEVICYANHDWRVILGEKFPIINDNNEMIALGLNAVDITSSNLAILNFEQLLCKNIRKNKKQFSYIIGNSYDNETKLTKRQTECLFHLLRGGTSASISNILNISTRTAEFHINSLREKFNCFSKQDLIEKCIHLGYLNLIPSSYIFT